MERGETYSSGSVRGASATWPRATVCGMSNLVPVIIAVLMVLAAPLWPWSKGWTWAPAGMLAMGLVTMLLFRFAVLPEA